MTSFCFACRTEVPDYYFDHPNGARIECLVCGIHIMMEQGAQRIAEMRISGFENQPITRLSAAIRQRTERGEMVRVTDPRALMDEYEPASDLLDMIDRICVHIRTKAPAGHRFVPLIGHRDCAIAGAEDAPAFDHALGRGQELGYIEREALDEAAYRLTPGGFLHLRELDDSLTTVRSIFLSHAARDRGLAMFVRDQILASRPGIKVFVASRPGDIRADEDWLIVIQRELRAADAYCVLLTPNSNGRPWVWFETGAAWMSEKKWVIARAGLSQNAIPLPLSIRQTYSLEDPDGAREIFRALDCDVTDIASFVATVQSLPLSSRV